MDSIPCGMYQTVYSGWDRLHEIHPAIKISFQSKRINKASMEQGVKQEEKPKVDKEALKKSIEEKRKATEEQTVIRK